VESFTGGTCKVWCCPFIGKCTWPAYLLCLTVTGSRSFLSVCARERCRERERERTGRVRREMEEGAERAGRLWRRVWRAELRAPACFAASEQGVGGDVISPRRRDGGVRSEQSSERRSGDAFSSHALFNSFSNFFDSILPMISPSILILVIVVLLHWRNRKFILILFDFISYNLGSDLDLGDVKEGRTKFIWFFLSSGFVFHPCPSEFLFSDRSLFSSQFPPGRSPMSWGGQKFWWQTEDQEADRKGMSGNKQSHINFLF
jgi:hypothetical protein